eukprot:TRINITY_DN28435_c0_g1_i1.p1 TRINITY_DN28435_c0_g1~~TRINITY_DN28435_c0_g1_i1.p1  ORF type:complete len:433 (-),score=24.12 TRINITY_DN28435_c0_g1_i1:221-1519(-)
MMPLRLRRRLYLHHRGVSRLGRVGFSSQSESFPAGTATWSFPRTVYFGIGRSAELPALLQSSSVARPLVVSDRGLGRTELVGRIVDNLRSNGLDPLLYCDVEPNPRDIDITLGAQRFRDHNADVVIAIGGGSGLDAGKCIAMVANSQRSLEEFEWTREPCLLPSGAIPPVWALPTTAGTGAEMDPASMYTDTTRGVKICATHPDFNLSVIADPYLTKSMPPHITAWTGMDALTHAIEAYSVPEFHPMCDGIAVEALQLMKEWLPLAVREGENLEARSNMMAASSMAAVAFQKGLGAVHGLSEPIGAVYNTQHGLTNAMILPHVLRRNRPMIESKITKLARCLSLETPPASYHPAPTGFEAVAYWIDSLLQEFRIPHTLEEIGVSLSSPQEEYSLAEKAAANPTGFTNPVKFGVDDYVSLLRDVQRGRDRARF